MPWLSPVRVGLWQWANRILHGVGMCGNRTYRDFLDLFAPFFEKK
jgi:hypothetical protein